MLLLRLRSCILSHLPSYPAASPITFPLHRLLSAAAPAVSPNPSFAVEEYLIDTCGLTRAQALKASRRLSHFNSPTNPDAVLAFLAGLGLSTADVAAVVAKDPQLLCASVDRTLAPNVVGLTGIGLSHTEIARLVSVAPFSFRYRSAVSNLPYYLLLSGSYENVLRILKKSSSPLGRSLEKVVKPRVALLRECGLGACDIAKLCVTRAWLLTTNLERVRVIVARAESLGVPRGSAMFRHALEAVAFLSKEKMDAQVENLKNTFRWSDAEVCIAVSRLPMILKRSKDNLQSRSEFLILEAGLEPAYIAHRPALLAYSLEGRLRPRYHVVKFLKAKGLLDNDRDYYTTVTYSEKVFAEKLICPHKEAAPHLAEDYAAACRGEMPTDFRCA
uniref:Uncharacterized protein n=1 Tax=Avena sativa TaxID=4498 RepID=A0ACD5UIT1_AVESA